MTTSLPLRGVYRYIKHNYTLIFLPGINTEIKLQRGLPFILDLFKTRIFLFLKWQEMELPI
jgi:hypothetical protein